MKMDRQSLILTLGIVLKGDVQGDRQRQTARHGESQTKVPSPGREKRVSMEGEERIQGKSETSSLPSSKWAFALEQSGTSPQLTSQFRGPSQVPESQARSQGEKTVFPIY